MLEDTVDILGLLFERKSLELEWVKWVSKVTKDYNLHSRSKLLEVTKTLVPIKCYWKKKLTPLLVTYQDHH